MLKALKRLVKDRKDHVLFTKRQEFEIAVIAAKMCKSMREEILEDVAERLPDGFLAPEGGSLITDEQKDALRGARRRFVRSNLL